MEHLFKKISVASFLLLPLVAWGSPIIYLDDAAGNLATVDVSTGQADVIGNTGANLTDIAFDSNGNLYGISFSSLYSINKNTAQSTLIGAHGIFGGNALVFGNDGTLYSASNSSSDLFTIDPTTGASQSIGNIGYSSSGDLAFNGDSFFLSSTSNELIDISSLPGTSKGQFGTQNVFGIATASDGILYGVAGQDIYSINTTNGNATFVSSFQNQGLSIANGESFYTEAGAPPPDGGIGGGNTSDVPEPGSFAMLALGLLGLIGFTYRKRA